MRFFAPIIALCAAVATAQNSTTGSGSQNIVSIPEGGLQISAGSSNTVRWTNPSSGTLTVKLQVYGSNITPTSGLVVASGVPASAGSATFTVPASAVNPNVRYVIETIDESNANNYNFSNDFSISGATGTATGFPGSSSSTTSASSSSSTGSSSSMNTTTMTSSRSSSSTTSTRSTSSTASQASEPAPTNTGAGVALAVNGGLAMLVAGAVMAF